MPNPDDIELTMSRDLACARCAYSLEGLSITGHCPECGLAISATLLSRVDPLAPELRPVNMRPLRAAGVVAWPLGAIVAALAVWILRASEIAASAGPVPGRVLHVLPMVGVLGLSISAAGALALIRPHDLIPARRTARAILGVALYIPLVLVFWHIHTVLDRAGGARYFQDPGPPNQRTIERLAFLAVAASIALLLRPSARLLAGRCLVYRHGRADRQTIYAFVAALALTALGDVLILLLPLLPETARAVPRLLAWVIIAAGSLFVTVGLGSILIDAVRVARTILEPPPSLESVVAARAPDEAPHAREPR